LVREKLSFMYEAGASSQELAAELEYSKNDIRCIVEKFHNLHSNSNLFHYFLGNIVRHIFEKSVITPRLTLQTLNLICASVSQRLPASIDDSSMIQIFKYFDTPKLKPSKETLLVFPLRAQNEYAKHVRCTPP
jgi:hypothetical protein